MRRTAHCAAIALLYLAAPAALAAEIINTPYTWFCANERKAHGRCTTKWSGVRNFLLPPRLNFSCELHRASYLQEYDKKVLYSIPARGTFDSRELDAPLYGLSTFYCTHNASFVRQWGLTRYEYIRDPNVACRSYSSAGLEP